MQRELKLSYEVKERFGDSTVEISVSNGDERVILFHERVNPHYRYGVEEAAWGIVVDKLGGLLVDPEEYQGD